MQRPCLCCPRNGKQVQALPGRPTLGRRPLRPETGAREGGQCPERKLPPASPDTGLLSSSTPIARAGSPGLTMNHNLSAHSAGRPRTGRFRTPLAQGRRPRLLAASRGTAACFNFPNFYC